LESNGALDEIVESLRDAGVAAVRTETISREPLVEDIDRCVAFLRKQNAGAGDLLLGIGGGSAIDVAKAAGALVAQDSTTSVLDYLEGVGKGLKIENTPLPVLAMPTTAGTGSEATKNAVISSHDPPFKKSLRSELMIPRIVLVDPELAVSVPPQVTAWTGMDAITQLIESFLSSRATQAAQSIALHGMQSAVDYLAEAVRNGRSRQSREAMARAALLSGIALANSGLGMAHGVAAALGVHSQVPHGLACAVMLPAALQANSSIEGMGLNFARIRLSLIDPSSSFFGDEAGAKKAGDILAFARLNERDGTEPLIALITALLAELKIPRRLSEIGVKREQIPAIVRDSRGNSMSGNPRELSDEELSQILENML
jgi:alcohol dehydrogenase class IV